MSAVSCCQYLRSRTGHFLCLTRVYCCGSKQRQTAVPVHLVIPVKEFAEYQARLFFAFKASRYLRSILHRFEMALRKGIVVACVRAGMALDNAQIGKEFSHGYARHLAAVIRMYR